MSRADSVLTTIVMVAVVLVAGFRILEAMESGKMSDQLSEARAIHLAMQQATLDGMDIGAPADIGATSAREYIYRLVPKYISKERADSFLGNFLVGNVSGTDSGDTILFRSRPSESWFQKYFMVYRRAGDGAILQSRQSAAAGKEPPRNPPYLAD